MMGDMPLHREMKDRIACQTGQHAGHENGANQEGKRLVGEVVELLLRKCIDQDVLSNLT